MYWKMSIDLSRPLVPSMGHHDPLDGFVTYNELQANAAKDFGKSMVRDLHAEITDMADICEGRSWTTDDPLGIGSLLFDACWVAQLIASGNLEKTGLLVTLLESSLIGLESFAREDSLKLPADYRLAFRELGLSIGLRAVEKVQELMDQKSGPLQKTDSLFSLLKALSRYVGLSESVETVWLERRNRECDNWIEHRDINMVMLATSLSPDGFLKI